jgi:hypothetical protein
MEYRSNDNVSSYPPFDVAQDKLQRVSRLIVAETNLDSRVRGNDESRGKNVPAATPPFSFVVRQRKLMTQFVVSYLTTTDRDTLLKSSASFTLQLE